MQNLLYLFIVETITQSKKTDDAPDHRSLHLLQATVNLILDPLEFPITRICRSHLREITSVISDIHRQMVEGERLKDIGEIPSTR